MVKSPPGSGKRLRSECQQHLTKPLLALVQHLVGQLIDLLYNL